MDGNDVVRDEPRAVRRRARKPKSKAFTNVTYLFTTSLSSYKVPVYTSKETIDEAVGYYDEECHEIAVRVPAPSPAAEADRMLHEHLHALSHILLPADSRLSELQVNTISTSLVDLLIRNDALREFLVERLVHSEHLYSKQYQRTKADKRPAADGDSLPDTRSEAPAG